MQQIAADQPAARPATSADDATTADAARPARRYIDQLSQLMDINVVQNDHNQVTVFTNSGIQLVGIAGLARFLRCPGHDDARRRNGTPTRPSAPSARIMLTAPNGGDVDLIANKSIRSGKIAAYLEMRDQVLVQAQAQLDEIAAAHGAARCPTRRSTARPRRPAPQSGFDIDIGGLLDRQYDPI